MNTRFYCFLAFLISIFALTSSFSLSMEDMKSKPKDIFNSYNAGGNEDVTDKLEGLIPPPKLYPPKKDQNTWVFEHTNDTIESSCGKENGASSSAYNNKLANDLKRLNLEEPYDKKNPHYAFRIYKKGKYKEQQIIGLIFGNKKLVLFDKKGEVLMIRYIYSIHGRKIDLKNQKEPISFDSHEKNKCFLQVNWIAPDPEHQKIMVFFNKDKKIQMDDSPKSSISNYKEKKLRGRRVKTTKKNTSWLLDPWMWVFAIILILLVEYEEGYFFQNSSQKK